MIFARKSTNAFIVNSSRNVKLSKRPHLVGLPRLSFYEYRYWQSTPKGIVLYFFVLALLPIVMISSHYLTFFFYSRILYEVRAVVYWVSHLSSLCCDQYHLWTRLWVYTPCWKTDICQPNRVERWEERAHAEINLETRKWRPGRGGEGV